MKVVILHWPSAENDPFGFASKNFAKFLAMSGRSVEILSLADPQWAGKVQAMKSQGLEYVMTFQGLGTKHYVDERSIWDLMEVPLVCLHGDHPCHWPANHKLDSRYCLHLYTNAEWAEYANRHFHKKFAASVGSRFLYPPEPIENDAVGDFFVMAKNIKTPKSFEIHWEQDHEPKIAKAMLGAASMLRSALTSSEGYIRIHDLIDAYIEEEKLDFLKVNVNSVLHHSAHSQLDFYMRNLKSVMVLDELRDVPLRIFGRGWEEFESSHSAHHRFSPGLEAEKSRELYSSRFGVVDISPAQNLHDRSRRAMSNKSSFTTNAALDFGYEPERYPSLFFTYKPGSLRETAEVIMSDPAAHRHACAEFSSAYQKLHRFEDFFVRLENFARGL